MWLCYKRIVPSPPNPGSGGLVCWGQFYTLNVGLKEIFQVVDSWCKELTVRWTVLTYLLVLGGNRRCGTLGPTALSNNPASLIYLHLFFIWIKQNKIKTRISRHIFPLCRVMDSTLSGPGRQSRRIAPTWNGPTVNDCAYKWYRSGGGGNKGKISTSPPQGQLFLYSPHKLVMKTWNIFHCLYYFSYFIVILHLQKTFLFLYLNSVKVVVN